MTRAAATTQDRGHCQCCGRLQAVRSRGANDGLMSQHGYTVEVGWFNGVCSGHLFAPMERDRRQTNKIVGEVRADVARLEVRAADLAAGRVFPELANDGYCLVPWTPRTPESGKPVRVPFAKAPAWCQTAAVDAAIAGANSRARQGAAFATQLERLAAEVHGQPLTQVEREDKTPLVHLAATNGYAPRCARSFGRRSYPRVTKDRAELTCPKCIAIADRLAAAATVRS